MSKHLTITRLGLLTADLGVGSSQLSGPTLVAAFRRQAESLAGLFPQNVAPKDIQQIEIVGIPSDGTEGALSGTPKQEGSFEAFEALLPSIEREMKIGANSWRLSLRVSISSHDLQGQSGRSKIWLTVAGMPHNGDGKDEVGPSSFLDWINEQEEDALKALKNAYRLSLEAVSAEHSRSLEFEEYVLKISVTDDDTRATASLVDAMYFDGIEPTQINSSHDENVREGLLRLDDFISHAASKDSTFEQDNLSIESSVPGIKGIICNGRSSRYASLVAGFARRAGDGGGYQEVLDRLDGNSRWSFERLRARSPARHLSARLAEMEAHKWNLRLPAPSLGL
jgi:hypothetical protein